MLFDHLHLINNYNMNPYNYSIYLPHGSGVPYFVCYFVYVVDLLILIYDHYVNTGGQVFSFLMGFGWECWS